MSSVVDTAIPLKERPGFMLPEDGGTYIVDSIVKGKALTAIYQKLFGLDQYISLPTGKEKADYLTIIADQFQLQGVTPGSCEKMQSHGGFSTGSGSLETCPIGHYSVSCPIGNFAKCHQHLLNDFNDEEVIDENLDIVELQFQKLARQVLRNLPAHYALGHVYKFVAAAGTTKGKTQAEFEDYIDAGSVVGYGMDESEEIAKPDNVNDKKWRAFKTELTVNCKGWVADALENKCDVFSEHKDELVKCGSAADRILVYDKIFADLLCCAENEADLADALDGNLEDDMGNQLIPYIRISKAIWSDLNIITRNNSAKQENGCNSVCNAFTYGTETCDGRTYKVIYWNNYLLAVDDGVCSYDNVLGVKTYMAAFTIAKNIQYTAGWEYLDDDIIPLDYTQGQQRGDYNRPVLAFQKKSTSLNCKDWEAKMTMRIGAGVCEKSLMVIDFCTIKK